jgi:hypothetical protein
MAPAMVRRMRVEEIDRNGRRGERSASVALTLRS